MDHAAFLDLALELAHLGAHRQVAARQHLGDGSSLLGADIGRAQADRGAAHALAARSRYQAMVAARPCTPSSSRTGRPSTSCCGRHSATTRAMAERGRTLVEREHSVEHMLDRLTAVYERHLRGG